MPRLSPRRPLQFQTLGERCPLAAEGSPFTLADLPAVTGLIGDVEVRVDYGDATPAVTLGTVAAPGGRLSFRFDYSLDDPGNGGSGFFHGENQNRRQLLELAGRSLTQHLDDSFAAVPVDDNLRWEMRLANPSPGVETIVLPGIEVAANEILVYVGARHYEGNQVAEAGFGFAGVVGPVFLGPSTGLSQRDFDDYVDLIRNRGQYDGRNGSPVETSVLAATVGFDTSAHWSFDIDGTGSRGGTHFVSVAAHELLHVLGFGHAFGSYQTPWNALSVDGNFVGTEAVATNEGQSLRLNAGGHLDRDTLADGSTPLSAATLRSFNNVVGTSRLTDVELAILDDLGYDVLRPSTAGIAASPSRQHVYGDEGDYEGQIQLVSRSGLASVGFQAAVTNVAPTLTLPAIDSPRAGQSTGPIEIQISDPGFARDERFTYEIIWGDGEIYSGGRELIVTTGRAGVATSTSLTVSHQYQEIGTYEIVVVAMDNDGGRLEETMMLEVLAADPPIDSFDRFDVNRSGTVSALDALWIINAINRNDDPIELDDASDSGARSLDVNRDSWVTPLDALLVINRITADAPSEGSSEPAMRPRQPAVAAAGSIGSRLEDEVDGIFAELGSHQLF